MLYRVVYLLKACYVLPDYFKLAVQGTFHVKYFRIRYLHHWLRGLPVGVALWLMSHPKVSQEPWDATSGPTKFVLVFPLPFLFM